MQIVLTPEVSPPRVSISVTGLPASTARVEVRRLAGSDSWPVRGAAEALVGTGLLVVDREIPIGVAVTYQVTAWGASGSVVDTATGEVGEVAAGDDPSMVWLSDPLDETSAMQIAAQIGTDETRVRASDVRTVLPLGARYPITTVAAQGRMAEWTLAVHTDERQALALRQLLDQALVLCIRTHPSLQLPPIMYGVPAETVEAPWHEQLDYGTYQSLWTVRLSLTRGTELSPSIYAWTWGDVTALGLTWDQVLQRYPTWNDLKRGDG